MKKLLVACLAATLCNCPLLAFCEDILSSPGGKPYAEKYPTVDTKGKGLLVSPKGENYEQKFKDPNKGSIGLLVSPGGGKYKEETKTFTEGQQELTPVKEEED